MSKSLNVRSIVVGNKTWEKLRALGKEEERSMSELIREALLDLFDKRIKPVKREYDPTSDSFIGKQ